MKDKKQKAELDKEFKVAEEVAESDDLGLDREALGDDKYIEALEEKLGQAIAESVMCRNLTQRLQADFDNYRKKSLEQIAQSRYDGMADAITKMMPVLDSIASAKKMIKEEKLLEGFVMIENQLLNAFSSLGVEKIEAINQPFDPNLHNALAVQNNPDFDDDIVLEEYQAGYKLNDKVIRYSQVIVNKKEEE